MKSNLKRKSKEGADAIPEVNEESVKNVMESIMASSYASLFACTKEELKEKYWHFVWDDAKDLDHNLYAFTCLLEMYSRWCRRWSEHHRGSCCVVEYVRDEFIMPRIQDFSERVNVEFMKQYSKNHEGKKP